jgi:hypothetical protein
MFSSLFKDPFGSDGVACVKLPAAVAFPTDGRLLQRIEELRRALPANNMKPLWKSRERAPAAPSTPCESAPQTQPTIKVSLGTLDVPAARVELRPVATQSIHMLSVTLEPEPASSPEQSSCVVPMARSPGSLARARERLSHAGAR